MWFLEHPTLFGGKRVWLKPGRQYMYGRTKGDKSGGQSVVIESKNVSRKHMLLRVLDVPAGDGTKLHSRSQVEVTDLSGASGIFIDGTTGTRLLGPNKQGVQPAEFQQKMIMPNAEHKIRLGNNYADFTLKWIPVVVTVATKETPAIKARNARLHGSDIKTATEFVYGKTTHVVTEKRNLPKVLHGLVNGAHIVAPAFVDAIMAVAETQNDDPENYQPSKLEEDFDEHWPQEREYLPPAGGEPVQRPPRMLEPEPKRAEVFSGLTFVFLNEKQYNNLHGPIAGGGGKALLFEVNPGETTVDEYVRFVENAAGEKGNPRKSRDRLPVVTVRLPDFPNESEHQWATNFIEGIDLSLNQRSVLQNEFLDAIIMNDASQLQKPPPEVEMASSIALPSREASVVREPPAASQPRRSQRSVSRALSQDPEPVAAAAPEPAKAVPRKRNFRRGATQSRFTGFDDYEPPTKTRKIDQDTPMEDIPEADSVQPSYQDSQPLFVPEHSQNSQASPRHTQTQIRKRRSPGPDTVESAEQRQEELFPAQAAIKRRRLAEQRAASASANPESAAAEVKSEKPGHAMIERLSKARKKIEAKEINVREATRARLQEEEERRRLDEESLREALESVDISEIRNLVQVEEMNVKPRSKAPAAQDRGVRWKEEWNGRKNFKKFRRRGVERGNQGTRVIVPLEEAPPRKGIVDAFLEETINAPRDDDETGASLRSRRAKDRREDDESSPEPGFRRTIRRKEKEVILVPDSGSEAEDAAGASSSRRTDRVNETQYSTQSQTQRGAKRGAGSVVAGQPAAKKGRTTRRKDESSDDEETGFRFRRR